MTTQRLHVGPRLSQVVIHGGTVYTAGIVADDANADVQALRVHMRHLRQKVEPDPDAPVRITTEPGVGYRFTAPE